MMLLSRITTTKRCLSLWLNCAEHSNAHSLICNPVSDAVIAVVIKYYTVNLSSLNLTQYDVYVYRPWTSGVMDTCEMICV